MRILHLEDDPIQGEIARRWLEQEGHHVVSCGSGEDAIRAVERDSFDLAILDWRLPGIGGDEVLRWIRRRSPTMPVMFATAHDEEAEIVHILGLGADDYLVKPLRRLEFLARVKALGRRVAGTAADEDVIEAPPYRLARRPPAITLHGAPVKVTPRMAQVALLLFRKRGELVSRAQIYEEVWGRRDVPESRTVDTHVSRLRSALELDGRHGWRLTSVYQHGYRLERSDS